MQLSGGALAQHAQDLSHRNWQTELCYLYTVLITSAPNLSPNRCRFNFDFQVAVVFHRANCPPSLS